MNKLELSLIEMANRHYLEAKSWAETKSYSETIKNMAEEVGLSEEQLVRHQWTESFTRCIAIVELSAFDSGISTEASGKLTQIETLVSKLERVRRRRSESDEISMLLAESRILN